MSIDSKNIATFLLGAAAGLAAHKYMSMTPEEKEKMASDLKDKAHQFKNDAEQTADKAKEYFAELKAKGTEVFKAHFGEAENMFQNIFGTKTQNTEAPAGGTGPAQP